MPLPEYLKRAYASILEEEAAAARDAKEYSESCRYKVWRLVSPMEADLIRRGELTISEVPGNPKVVKLLVNEEGCEPYFRKPFFLQYGAAGNSRLNKLVEEHLKKHGDQRRTGSITLLHWSPTPSTRDHAASARRRPTAQARTACFPEPS